MPARATCIKSEHYTPLAYIEGAVDVLGGVDLDPCADPNSPAIATEEYHERGAEREWFGNVYCNFPGDRRGRNLIAFWLAATRHARNGGATLWAGFAVNSLPRLVGLTLDDGSPCPSPIEWPFVLIGPQAPGTTKGGRIMWIDGATGEPGKSPGHGNYFCLLGGDEAQTARFAERFGEWGVYKYGQGFAR